jgi:hypothetical protein
MSIKDLGNINYCIIDTGHVNKLFEKCTCPAKCTTSKDIYEKMLDNMKFYLENNDEEFDEKKYEDIIDILLYLNVVYVDCENINNPFVATKYKKIANLLYEHMKVESDESTNNFIIIKCRTLSEALDKSMVFTRNKPYSINNFLEGIELLEVNDEKWLLLPYGNSE